MIEQLAFDFDLDAPEPLYFPTMGEATRCRECHHPVKGRHKLSTSGVTDKGWYVICDECIRAIAKAQYDAAPFRECGRHKEAPYDERGHAEDCLDNTCPWCGEQEASSFVVNLNHNPEAFISVRDRMCTKQRRARVLA